MQFVPARADTQLHSAAPFPSHVNAEPGSVFGFRLNSGKPDTAMGIVIIIIISPSFFSL